MPYRNLDQPRRPWCLFSGQGQLLLAVAATPERTTRQLAHDLGYDERRVTGFVHDLKAAGMLTRQRVSRHNRYTVHPAASARIPFLPNATVGDVLRGCRCDREEATYAVSALTRGWLPPLPTQA